MGAKEDLLAKMHARTTAKASEETRQEAQRSRFADQLPKLYSMLEDAAQGVPELTVEWQDVSKEMDKRYASLIVQFLGKTIRFDPQVKGGDYVVKTKGLDIVEIYFAPDTDGSWIATTQTKNELCLTADYFLNRLSVMVDEENDTTIKLWD
ncbi:hypothetical protein KAM380_083950 [Aeromonas caviae]|uniref:hypothetical protein n=1 Tax=Pseudomonas shirazica TaxID=1940636 RepID=UPI001C26E996|nr:hypothetical protein [Pseudomonas shirazica]GJB83930.1 hypothetical protein KAM380_083950 [Aeromonas caviae]